VLRVSPVIFWSAIHMLHSWSEIICCCGRFMCFVSSGWLVCPFRRSRGRICPAVECRIGLLGALPPIDTLCQLLLWS
jgi:hypothetical protein